MLEQFQRDSVIYFDWAATSLGKPREVKEAVLDAMQYCASASRGGYGPGVEAGKIEFQTRKKLCDFFGAQDFHNVIFTKNITEACNLFLLGFLKPGDHVISSSAEHNSILRPLHFLEQQGVQVTYLSIDERGRISFQELDNLKRNNTKLIVLAHASNVTGNLLDIKYISKWCHDNEVLLALDTAQTAGEIKIHMERDGIDVLLFTGHKSLLGPQGSGGMIFLKDIGVKPVFSGGSGIESFKASMPWDLPTRLEFGTSNIPAIAGLCAGVKYLEGQGVEKRFQKAHSLAKYFYEELKQIPGIICYGDFFDYESGVDIATRVAMVSFNYKEVPSSVIGNRLWKDGKVCVRTGSHCAPGIHRHFKTERQGMVRFSFSAENTVDEVNIALNILREMRQ